MSAASAEIVMLLFISYNCSFCSPLYKLYFLISALFLRLTGAGKPIRNQFFLYIPVNEGHHLGYIGLNVCFNKRVTALVWAAERELLGFWCHVCLFARAYLWICSCLLMSGRLCVCLSLVFPCTYVFCPLTSYLYPRGDSYSTVRVFLAWFRPC